MTGVMQNGTNHDKKLWKLKIKEHDIAYAFFELQLEVDISCSSAFVRRRHYSPRFSTTFGTRTDSASRHSLTISASKGTTQSSSQDLC